MCFIILNDLYMAHHNSLCICRQLKIRHLYGTFKYSTQCICIGTGSLLVYRFSSFSWKGAPSTKENGICGSVNCLMIKRNFLLLILVTFFFDVERLHSPPKSFWIELESHTEFYFFLFYRSGGWTAEGTNHHCPCPGCAGRGCHPLRYRVLWQCPQAAVEGYQAAQRKGRS